MGQNISSRVIKKEGNYIADISTLGQLQPVEPLDLENYADNRESAPLPPKGRYTVQAPDTFPSPTFGRSQAGALTAQIDPKIVGPTNEGFVCKFTKVSAKQFRRNGVVVSQLGDYLRAVGLRRRLTDEQEQADAIEQTVNLTYEVEGDWRAYNSKAKRLVAEGMEHFPSDGNGGHLPWIPDPIEKDENGEPVRVRANFVITRYVPQPTA